jgi:hypothetical protein
MADMSAISRFARVVASRGSSVRPLRAREAVVPVAGNVVRLDLRRAAHPEHLEQHGELVHVVLARPRRLRRNHLAAYWLAEIPEGEPAGGRLERFPLPVGQHGVGEVVADELLVPAVVVPAALQVKAGRQVLVLGAAAAHGTA